MSQPNFVNRTLFHGDNLDFLRGINSGSVHLVATDPPFNKSRDFHASPDSLAKGARFKDRWNWERDVQEIWWNQIYDDWRPVYEVIDAAKHSYGDDMAAFLCWLGVRLIECHRVLRKDGSLYLHIDHTAHAYVKCMLDGIFGAKNFRNEIVWCYSGGGVSKNSFARKHDTLLLYAKSENTIFNRQYRPYGKHNTTGKRATSRGGTRKTEYRKEGAAMNDWWQDVKPLINWDAERLGYPTQKPLALYERIIKASSNPGDFVLDPFCGCATTPVAAERLGRQWIGMDIWDGAGDIVKHRLEKEGIVQEGKSASQMFTHHVHILTEPPIRTDDAEVAAPAFRLRSQRVPEKWERLTHKQITSHLAQFQATNGGIICAGCGRVLELEFMQLDHIMPRTDGGENHILNRILLCGPCNRRKGAKFTLTGLVKENKKKAIGWMKDPSLAKLAWDNARNGAESVRLNEH